MAYDPLSTSEIEAGDPVRQELWTKIKNNQDDFDSRLDALEAVTFSSVVPLTFKIDGPYADFVGDENLDFLRLSGNITVLAARLVIIIAGSSSSTEVDVEYKRGAAAFTTIFSTKPSVSSASGNFAISTNAVLSVTELDAGDLIRLNLDATQGGEPSGLRLFLEFEPR